MDLFSLWFIKWVTNLLIGSIELTWIWSKHSIDSEQLEQDVHGPENNSKNSVGNFLPPNQYERVEWHQWKTRIDVPPRMCEECCLGKCWSVGSVSVVWLKFAIKLTKDNLNLERIRIHVWWSFGGNFWVIMPRVSWTRVSAKKKPLNKVGQRF